MANTAPSSDTLFPILQRPAGLCRMAAESEHMDAGHDVEFRSLEVRSVLNRSVSKRLQWMAWSINPYRGCEFGCRYCYARSTHEFLAPAPAARDAAAAGEAFRGILGEANEVGQGAVSRPARYSTVSSRSAAEGFASGSRPGDEADLSAALPGDTRTTLTRTGDATSSGADLRDPMAFERRIFVKSNAAWLLEQDLRRLAKGGRLHEEIALGTATDPWQPIERRTGLTRSLLEVMAKRDGLRLGVVTKSTLIERDLDLLKEIHRRGTLVVHITITTPDVELARKLEPRAPRPDLRFQTVLRLREAGLRVGILNSPLLPGITDSAEAIDRMAALARQADASFFAAMPLFLKPCSRPTYFDFVREHFPQLQVLYAEKFRDMDFAARPYRERLRALVTASCRRHGLCERSTDSLLTKDAGREREVPSPKTGGAQQQNLFS